MDRREFLKMMALCGVYGAMDRMGGNLFAAQTAPLKRRKAAKSIIEIWVWGGPSHLETFDPKPNAGKAYNGDFGDIATNVPGIRISEFLPKLAQMADKYSIIRSMNHRTNGHETATYLMQTGRMPGDGITYPAIGAVIAMLKSSTYKGKLPPYIALTSNKGRFSENGFLSDRFKPLATGSNPNAAKFLVDGFVAPGGISDDHLKKRSLYAEMLDSFSREAGSCRELLDFEQAGSAAAAVLEGDDAKAFDLNLETPAMRDRYGRNKFGQCCLAARRLVELGVPYITINASGWDTHKKHFEAMQKLGPEFDQGFSALLEDLSEKKLLDSTLIWCTGEFGRTPKVDYGEPWNGGRNHFCSCFSTVVAGGGFAGGKVIGASNATGERPVERPVSPVDLLWSLYELAGIDPAAKLPNPRNFDLTILPQGGGKNKLRELYKEEA
ncbi:MAG: DUF1501 domain-containing protein [Lentisphaeria bacterium]|nr:DUF1501 domain-containing protein [Lentisphaeria bacterium]MBQ9804879.1 DUF1501 domain-containing protein [Lentisphaeria bacterium]